MSGHVVQFEVSDDFLKKYKAQKVGLDHYLEPWIPAEDIKAMNHNIIGNIELISTFR